MIVTHVERRRGRKQKSRQALLAERIVARRLGVWLRFFSVRIPQSRSQRDRHADGVGSALERKPIAGGEGVITELEGFLQRGAARIIGGKQVEQLHQFYPGFIPLLGRWMACSTEDFFHEVELGAFGDIPLPLFAVRTRRSRVQNRFLRDGLVLPVNLPGK